MDEGVYDKYRVVKTEDLDAEIILRGNDFTVRSVISAIEIGTFVFVLRPDRDYHARVALAAYAASVVAYNTQLAGDLNDALELMAIPLNMEPD